MNGGDPRQEGGWYVVWRALHTSPVWTEARYEWRSLLDILMDYACWRPSKCKITGRGYVELDVGQLCRSADQLCRAAGSKGKPLTRQTFRSAMKHFKEYEFLTYETTKNQHLITITNYKVYQLMAAEANQQNNHGSTNSQPRANHGSTTSEEVNKEIRKNGNTHKPEPATKPKPPAVCVFDAKPYWELARTHCPEANRDVAMFWFMNNVRSQEAADRIKDRLPEWDVFRNDYPHQLGMDSAFLWWCQFVRTPEQAAEILEGLARWKASDLWSRSISVFNADTFLTKKKYRVDPPPERKPAATQIDRARELMKKRSHGLAT